MNNIKTKKWQIQNELTAKDNPNIDEIIRILLENREIITDEEKEAFLNPRLEDINFDSVGINAENVAKTITRLKKAFVKKEQIIIFGDYDVDGITASAILWETLHELGANVTPYIPHRLEEGYGLSIPGINNVKTNFPKVKLIITVDNGIVANEAINHAKKEGIEVIVTDHHTTGNILPNSLAIVHTTKLCGAGVAWLLAKEIKKQFSKSQNPEDNHLELAALGTIADLVPLTAANRAIVKSGLQGLCKTKRIGLMELFKEARCESNKIGVYEVGHLIAPRLNATGRMHSAMESLRLLCTKNQQRAQELASLLGTTNKERQNVLLDAAKHASLSVQGRQELKKLLVVAHESYPEGVIGLVAGRLVEEFYRPTIVISKGEKISKGSVRSISGFNIIDFLRQSSELFVNIGGHPMAAGFTIETEKINQVTEILEKLAHEAVDESIFTRTLKIDCELPLYSITDKFYSQLQQLSPFGMANPEPTFVSKGLIVEDYKILGKDGKHLKIKVKCQKSNVIIDAIAFGFGDYADSLKIGDEIELVYTVDENTWNGKKSLQLKVKDLKAV